MEHKPDKPKIRILVVDDDQANIDIILKSLAPYDYDLSWAESGEQTLGMLGNPKKKFDIVLLDRLMPGISGMEVLKCIKNDPELRHISIIMQTSLAGSDDIIEGIRAGAMYYLTKPFQKRMLVSIVEAAADDIRQHRINKNELNKHRMQFGMVDRCHLTVKTLNEARSTALFLSHLYPEPERVLFGIHELIVNAIEHGNLGVGYDKKTELLNEGTWMEEIERRLNLHENINKMVNIRYTRKDDIVELLIEDHGEGFDWQNFIEIAPSRATHNHGRGIAIAKLSSFDNMKYIGAGSAVCCEVEYTDMEFSGVDGVKSALRA